MNFQRFFNIRDDREYMNFHQTNPPKKGGEQLTKIQQIKSVTLLISDRFKLKIEKRDKSIFSHIPMSPASFFTNNNHGKIGCSTMSDQTINYPRDNYIYF